MNYVNERVLKIGNKKDNKHFFKIISRNCFTIWGPNVKKRFAILGPDAKICFTICDPDVKKSFVILCPDAKTAFNREVIILMAPLFKFILRLNLLSCNGPSLKRFFYKHSS